MLNVAVRDVTSGLERATRVRSESRAPTALSIRDAVTIRKSDSAKTPLDQTRAESVANYDLRDEREAVIPTLQHLMSRAAGR